MIAFLYGRLVAKGEDFILLDVQGVGYRVFVPQLVSFQLPKLSETILLFTYYHHREDQVQLYGFLSWQELDFFKLLLDVSGIGPKAAMTILSVFPAREVEKAILGEDINSLTAIPGIGRKTAQRLVVELKDKLLKRGKASALTMALPATGKVKAKLEIEPMDNENAAEKTASESAEENHQNSIVEEVSFLSLYEDALAALTTLGYSQNEARFALGKVQSTVENNSTLADIIRLALQKLVR